MLGNLTGWHLIIILAVVLLLFGATKLPALAKSVGQSAKIFKNEMKGLNDDEPKTETVTKTEAVQAPTSTQSSTPESSQPKP